MSFLVNLWAKRWLYLAAIGATIAGIAGAYLKGRSDQSSKTAIKQKDQTIKDLRKSREIENEVNKKSDAELDDYLSKFVRD